MKLQEERKNILKKINFFDIHSHLHSNFFKEDTKEILEQMEDEKVWTISVGVDLDDSKKAVSLAKKHKNISATIGIHPTEKTDFNEKEFQDLLDKNKDVVVGIGECGLDYYWPSHDLKLKKINENDLVIEKERQKKLFLKQIEFAINNKLPMMLHVRSYKFSDAHLDTLEILEKFKNTELKVNFHFFTEDIDMVKQILKMNSSWTCSLPGVITFSDLDKIIVEIPIKNIMSETDSPYATPTPHRGKINNPLYVKEIVKKISKIKKFEFKETNEQLIANAVHFWNIKI